LWWKHVGNPRTNAAGSRPKHSSTSVSELWANVLPYADDAEDKRPFGDSDVWLSRMRSLAHRSCRRPSQLARFKRPVASIYLAAGLSHRGLSFSGPGSVPASAPQAHLSPSGAWGPFLHRSEACPPSFRVGVARLNVAPPVASRFRHFAGGELVRPNVIVKPLFKLKFEKGDLGG